MASITNEQLIARAEPHWGEDKHETENNKTTAKAHQPKPEQHVKLPPQTHKKQEQNKPGIYRKYRAIPVYRRAPKNNPTETRKAAHQAHEPQGTQNPRSINGSTQETRN
jgi:hypothetical protein